MLAIGKMDIIGSRERMFSILFLPEFRSSSTSETQGVHLYTLWYICIHSMAHIDQEKEQIQSKFC